jgi:hypothetical protein
MTEKEGERRLIDWLGGYLGGGKAPFKFVTKLQDFRKGTISKPMSKALKDCGFTVVSTPKKPRVK